MPVYEYTCGYCGKIESVYRKLEERNDAPKCHGGPMERLITAPMAFVRPDICYDSPIDGRPITSAQARKEDLARSGCREYDPGMKQDYQRRIVEGEKKLDKAVDETIDRTIATMPARKREKLQAELEGGMSVEPERLTAPYKPISTKVNHG